MGKDGQKSNKPSKSPKKKSPKSTSSTPKKTTAGMATKSSKGASKAVSSKMTSKPTKSSKATSSSNYSQAKSTVQSSKVSKGSKAGQRSPRKAAASSSAAPTASSAVASKKKSPKSTKSKGTKKSASTSADESTAEVKQPKAKKAAASSSTSERLEEAEYVTAEEKAEPSATSEQAAEDEGEAVESEVIKKKAQKESAMEKPLEFTKPTINQMKKEKKDKPLSMAERITSREFEQLFDEINELNSGVQMLKHSYASIIKSLVAIQTRRGKKKSAKEVPASQRKQVADAVGGGKVTFLTTLSTCNPNELRTKSVLENTDKYDIENFLNPGTRDETFQMLFDEIDDLTKRFELMRTFFDDRGRFRRDQYDNQEDVKMDRAMYNEFKIWCKKLSDIVDDIARNYNDDLLNMFRLN